MEVKMGGQNGVSWSRTRESGGEICMDAIDVEQRLLEDSSGPTDHEVSPSSDSRTGLNLSVNQLKGKELHPVNVSHIDAVTGEATFHVIADSLFCLNGEGNCLENPGDNSKEGEGLVNPQAMKLTNTDAQGKPDSRAERDDTSGSKLDVSLIKSSFEARLNANAQETLRLNEDLKATFQKWEFELREQKQLVFDEEEVSKLQRENQKLCELMITDSSTSTQVMELHETIRVIAHSMRQLPIQLEVAMQHISLKTSTENEQLKAHILLLEEAKSKVEKKAEMIQQELCKEKAGHHGSYVDGSQTPFLLESAATAMFSSIATFSTLVSKYKDSNGYLPALSWVNSSRDPWNAVSIARKHHWTYKLKTLVCDRLFTKFEQENFTESDRVLFLDHEERVSACFKYYQESNKSLDRAAASNANAELMDYLFFHYFRSLDLLPPEANQLGMAFRDYDELIGTLRNKIEVHTDVHRRRVLCRLIIAAKKVWDFHKLCLSFDPPATIFRVSTGDLFNGDYMESIDVPDNDARDTVPTVGFMVYPGFRLRKSIIKCQVYLTLKAGYPLH